MSTDLNSFIRFANTTTNSKATIGLSDAKQAQSPAGEDFKLKSTSTVGRFFASIRNAFAGPSASETRAVQAFIQAIKQEYGSEGTQILNRFGVRADKPLKTFHVQQIANTLNTSRSDQNLRDFQDFPESNQALRNNQAAHRSNAYHYQNETPLYRAVSAAIAQSIPDAQAAINALADVKHPSPAQQLVRQVAEAVVAGAALDLMAIPPFKAQYQKRLEVDSQNLEAPSSVTHKLQSDAEVHAAGVVYRLLQDTFASVTSPVRT